MARYPEDGHRSPRRPQLRFENLHRSQISGADCQPLVTECQSRGQMHPGTISTSSRSDLSTTSYPRDRNNPTPEPQTPVEDSFPDQTLEHEMAGEGHDNNYHGGSRPQLTCGTLAEFNRLCGPEDMDSLNMRVPYAPGRRSPTSRTSNESRATTLSFLRVGDFMAFSAVGAQFQETPAPADDLAMALAMMPSIEDHLRRFD